MFRKSEIQFINTKLCHTVYIRIKKNTSLQMKMRTMWHALTGENFTLSHRLDVRRFSLSLSLFFYLLLIIIAISI